MNQLEGNAVTRHFGDVVAVSQVNLRVDGGEVVGLVGANGSGKTTLIRMLLGLLAPTSGTVSLFGAPPAREARARVGYVPQLGGLYDDLTVMENLEFQHSAYAGKGRPRLPDDLADLANRICGGLSLGLRRRVGQTAGQRRGENRTGVGAGHHREPPLAGRRVEVGGRERGLQLVEGGVHLRPHFHRARRRLHAGGPAHEQFVVQHVAQAVQRMAHCRLGESKPRARSRDAAFLEQDVEHAQQVEVLDHRIL